MNFLNFPDYIIDLKSNWNMLVAHSDIYSWAANRSIEEDDWVFLHALSRVYFRCPEDATAFKLAWGDIIER